MRSTRWWLRALVRGAVVGAVLGTTVATATQTATATAAAPAGSAPTAAIPAAPQPAQPPPGPDEGEAETSASEPTTDPGPTTDPAVPTRPAPPPPLPEPAAGAVEPARGARFVRTSWEEHGSPNQMIIVHPDSIDVVTEGRLTRRVPRLPGVLTLAALDRLVPSTWLSIADGTAQLSAAVVLTRGTSMDLGDVRILRLVGGATAPDAASIYTGGGRLTLHDIAVTSWDATARQAMSAAAGRPFVVVGSGGRFEATDARFSDLGTPQTGPGTGRPGVLLQPDSGGSLIRMSLLRNSTGLMLDGSQGVRLKDVTAGDSTSDGLVLKGDQGTIMSGIRTERNGDNGLLLTGTGADRAVRGVTTMGNGAFGAAVVGQTGVQISDIVSSGDRVGGLRLSRSTDVTVTDFSATDQPVGVFTHLNSRNIVLDRLRIAGGRRGLIVEKSTEGLELTATTIDRASSAGISIGGRQVELRDVEVNDSRTGVRIERGAEGIIAIGLTLSGGQDGVVANPGTTGVVLQNVVADGVGNTAVRTDSPNARIIDGRITGGATGIDAEAATSISGTVISQANVGIRARSGEAVNADRVDVTAIAAGIDVAPGSPVLLTNSRVGALEAVRGNVSQRGVNELSLPPLNVLGAIGIPLVLLAIGLEQVHVVRQRRFDAGGRRRRPPVLPAGAR